MFSRKIIVLSLMVVNGSLFANPVETQQELEEILVKEKRDNIQASPFPAGRKSSDVVVSGEKLKTRSATLGNALADELGVHSNPFGGGASAPIIRGQEGLRVKILQNGTDVIDMSHLSPDHAVVTDTLLAQQVELVRGSSTLLYATASPAGVVNVVDERIPTRMPEKGYKGELGVRYNTNGNEKVAAGNITIGLGDHVAIRAEGLTRNAHNYKVPGINLGETINYVPDTYNKSHVNTFGLSFIGSRGYLGASYSLRRDNYGLPGHNHKYDECSAHIIDPDRQSFSTRPYLIPYPHLMEDGDILSAPHFHCDSSHASDPGHSHEHPYGHKHDHSEKGPWVDLVSKRTDVSGELKQPFPGLDKVRLKMTYAEYYHDEKDAGKSFEDERDIRSHTRALKRRGRLAGTFDNIGFNTRLEFFHTPVGNLNGVWGAQYQSQKADAAIPFYNDTYTAKETPPLVSHTNKQFSLFALEQYRHKNLTFEVGARAEKQKTPVHYDDQILYTYMDRYRNPQNHCGFFGCPPEVPYVEPDLSTFKSRAYSYAGSVLWDFHPDYRLSLSLSHNERTPAPMELYFHGKHLATNTFQFGNKNLKKERSNNIELGLTHKNDRWDAQITTYYNRFKNYIHNETIFRRNNLFMRRFTQSQAKFYGIEGQLGYKLTPNHKITLWGDYVRGKLFDLPKEYQKVPNGRTNVYTGLPDYDYIRVETDKERNAPRVPPARLGLRINSDFSERWSSSLAYTRAFTQNKVSKLESPTHGYHLLDFGLSYRNKLGKSNYKATFNANNLLNQKIYIHSSYHSYVPQIGRNFSVGLNVEF
ncbi:TonB-dependent receptor [Neisseria zalophi]|uniref:TonB-dependent receptor n=1 Tax=Neisseria zalophi TaxID=640030 RepID=A0A5J6PV85_9NEIS|nr:TonB-dependent receptor [Neisseria zalophi]QEY26581.1 TonB-dependent receptor [Neisseria zalophi]